MSEEFVGPAFHYGSRVLSTKEFDTTPLVDILADLQHIYGKPSYQELNAAFLRLNETMNRMQLFKVMLRVI